MSDAPPSAALDAIREALGPGGWHDDAEAMAPYLREERGLWQGRAALVARPRDTREVARVVTLCAGAGLPVVPQAGRTGLCGGGVPDSAAAVVLDLARLSRIRSVDPLDDTITVEAGCILADVQDAAAAVDRLFPLSLAAEGSCRIGGNLSTNAGGVQVLRYGNARDLVLGLEVVLPDGRIWDGLRRLRKNNTGYDLKHLFLGAEGTLGVITAACLKLFPRPRSRATAFAAVTAPAAALDLLARARAASGDQVVAFELMPRIGVEFVTRHIPGTQDPLAEPHAWYALIEMQSSAPAAGLEAAMETLLADAFEAGLVADATIARSEQQAAGLWRLRESMNEAQKQEGGSIKHDVSVPVSRVPAFIETATARLESLVPGARVVAFGHLGDGNVHFNLSQPPGMDRSDFLARWTEVNDLVFDVVAGMNGSFSAEHGIGILKRGEMARRIAPVELDLMRRVKQALDPAGIMNPGKVLPDAE